MKNKNFSEWVIALIVVACSVVLFLALAFALSGTMFATPGRTISVNFGDITGISLGSRVKYAGAVAGSVTGIQMLTAEERQASGDPQNAVRVTLALFNHVPPLHADASVTVAADTLLSDKFILISGGTPQAQLLAEGAVLQGVSPTTFDKLVRDLDGTLDGLKGLLSGAGNGTGDVFEKLRGLLADTQSIITEAKPVIGDAKILAADARQFFADNKEPVSRTISRLDKTVTTLDTLATRSNAFVAGNEKTLTTTISEFKVTAENLKVASTYTKILARNLTLRPSQLIWGNAKPPPLPTEQEILRATRPIPAN
ncbi:MAG TPA: MlaD family protein [Terrimicrobiaceae bacterium]|nr:MlaD family protein [Terrimicrobiaceae bacterium]